MNTRFHTTTSADGAATVTATGEIDLASAGEFRDALVEAGADRCGFTIDLTAVDYLDSAGIRGLYEFVASHTLNVLVQRGAAVALKVSGLVDVITVRHPSNDTAERGDASR